MTQLFRSCSALAVLLVASAAGVRADYTYTTTVSATTADASGLSITPISGTVSPTMSSNVAVATFTFAPTGTGSGSQNITITEMISGSAGTETVAIMGTVTYQYTPTFVASTFTASSETVTGSGYSVPTTFANYRPGANSPNGFANTLSLAIMPNAVPEPASVAMLGLGLVGTLGVAARRRRAGA